MAKAAELQQQQEEIFQTGLRLFAQIIAREIIKDRQTAKDPPSPDPPEDIKKRSQKCKNSL